MCYNTQPSSYEECQALIYNMVKRTNTWTENNGTHDVSRTNTWYENQGRKAEWSVAPYDRASVDWAQHLLGGSGGNGLCRLHAVDGLTLTLPLTLTITLTLLTHD